jgi:hypothetical protein
VHANCTAGTKSALICGCAGSGIGVTVQVERKRPSSSGTATGPVGPVGLNSLMTLTVAGGVNRAAWTGRVGSQTRRSFGSPTPALVPSA